MWVGDSLGARPGCVVVVVVLALNAWQSSALAPEYCDYRHCLHTQLLISMKSLED